ncbi:unnamed protein product, partial [Coregonus sp. 'balchen']
GTNWVPCTDKGGSAGLQIKYLQQATQGQDWAWAISLHNFSVCVRSPGPGWMDHALYTSLPPKTPSRTL